MWSKYVFVIENILSILITATFLVYVFMKLDSCSAIPELIPYCISMCSLMIILNFLRLIALKCDLKWLDFSFACVVLLTFGVNIWGIVISFVNLDCIRGCDDCDDLFFWVVFITTLFFIVNICIAVCTYTVQACYRLPNKQSNLQHTSDVV